MRWHLRNRDNDPVDPVPFIVVSLAAFLLTHGWGPLYLGALGFDPIPTFIILTMVLIILVGVAYYGFIWNATPEGTIFVSTHNRLTLLLYAITIGIGIMLLLALPFFFGP